MAKQPGYAAAIRAYLKGLAPGETASPREIAFDCGQIPRRSCRQALLDMLDRGEIERVSPGQYRYVATNYQGHECAVKDKILRSISMLGQFNVREIRLVSDADQTYIHMVVNELVASGDLESLGKQLDSVTGGNAPRYRVRWADKFYRRYVLKKADDDATEKGRKKRKA